MQALDYFNSEGLLSFATTQLFDQAERDFLLTLANAAAQARERSRLDAAERERACVAEELARVLAVQAAQAEAMATIGAALSGMLEPEHLYALILEQAVRLLPSDHAEVLEYEDGWATVKAAWGLPAPADDVRLFPIAGPDKPWLPTDHSGAVYVADTAVEPAWVDIPPHIGAHRIRSMLAAPLVIDGIAVGSLNLHSTIPGYYGEQHLTLATAFAERVCQALRNARLYRAEQERRRAAEEVAHHAAVLLLDLDGFKRVSDTDGHEVGDRLLKAVAIRPQASMRWEIRWPRWEAVSVSRSTLSMARMHGRSSRAPMPRCTPRSARAAALVRWEHSRLGLLPPERFIPAAALTLEITERTLLAQPDRAVAVLETLARGRATGH